MNTKENDLSKTDRWRTPIDELIKRLGFTLKVGNKSGGVVMSAPPRVNSANKDESKKP